jgi:F-type H+-transporting ATPase subunit gamma
MPSIKEYNRKIASLKNTSKITRTMKMVSASKLRRAQDAQKNAKAYAAEVNTLLRRIAGGPVDASVHPLLQSRPQGRNLLLVVFTSDKGLCGGFNNNLLRYAQAQVLQLEREGYTVKIATCSRRAQNAFKDSGRILKHYEGVTYKPDPRDAKAIADDVCGWFLSGEVDEVRLVYSTFLSPLSQKPGQQTLLPLATRDLEAPAGDAPPAAPADADFIAEPPIHQLLDRLVPRLVIFKVFFALLENAAGEHGARMTAMDAATKNAKEMIDSNTLLRNRARQAAITTELIEIISGAEALK